MGSFLAALSRQIADPLRRRVGVEISGHDHRLTKFRRVWRSGLWDCGLPFRQG